MTARTGSRVHLVHLHHAGGSHRSFRSWDRHLPEGWVPCRPRLPRTGLRSRHPVLHSFGDAVEHVMAQLPHEPGVPLAVFGHSMGALLGWHLAERLLRAGRPPVWLGVSASRGPHAVSPVSRLHALGTEQLRGALTVLGGLPAQTSDELVWSRIEPRVRSDLRLLGTRRRPAAEAALPIPISVFCGTQDRFVSTAQMHREWSRSSTLPLTGVHEYPGGHFYFADDPDVLVRRVRQDVKRALNPMTELPETG